MEARRFDRLAKAVAAGGSRRTVLGGLVAGAVVGLRGRRAAADGDGDGVAIADASGGNGNVAGIAGEANPGNDNDHGRDHDRDGDKENDRGDDRRDDDRLAADCLCSEETCCPTDETCCPRFDEGENEIGSTCCDSAASCACGDCVPFCDLDVPFQSCECNCPSGATQCTLSSQQTNPNTCCASDQECCRVGETNDPGAFNTCCDQGACNPGVGCE